MGLGKFREVIFPSRSSTKLPLMPFLLSIPIRTPNDIKHLDGWRGIEHRLVYT